MTTDSLSSIVWDCNIIWLEIHLPMFSSFIFILYYFLPMPTTCQNLSSPTRNQTHIFIGSPWTTKEVPFPCIFNFIFFFASWPLHWNIHIFETFVFAYSILISWLKNFIEGIQYYLLHVLHNLFSTLTMCALRLEW